jgi:hypothetical protein
LAATTTILSVPLRKSTMVSGPSPVVTKRNWSAPAPPLSRSAPGPAFEHVVAVVAHQGVVAQAAEDRVVARAAAQAVGQGVAGDLVGQCVAGAAERAAAEDEVLDVGRHVKLMPATTVSISFGSVLVSTTTSPMWSTR